MPRRGGSPRTLPRLSPLPCVRPLLHILFRAIIHGLRRQGVAGRGSADAEQSLFSRYYPRAAAATRALARGYPSGTPLTRLWALRAGWASREARCCAHGRRRGASSRWHRRDTDAPWCIRFGDVGRRRGASRGGALAQGAPLGALPDG